MTETTNSGNWPTVETNNHLHNAESYALDLKAKSGATKRNLTLRLIMIFYDMKCHNPPQDTGEGTRD